MLTIDTTEEGKPRLCLPAVSDLTIAHDLRRELLAALARGEGLEVDVSEVRRVTTPCMPVLVAAVKSFALDGGPGLRFVRPSEAFGDTVAGLALEPIFAHVETVHE